MNRIILVIIILIQSGVTMSQSAEEGINNRYDISSVVKTKNDTTIILNTYANAEITAKTFMNNESIKSWGYNIFIDGKQYIRQPNIPALNGNRGFADEESAKKIAGLVIIKIKKNILPPSISINELDSLGVLNYRDNK
ncbi:MAG: DUF4907 domain-containing protein [Bacteroidetes bacterium]|nr:DUF4907 domain-containing protein [Bacteroidota bacterium]